LSNEAAAEAEILRRYVGIPLEVVGRRREKRLQIGAHDPAQRVVMAASHLYSAAWRI
jgi:hypothetical protein